MTTITPTKKYEPLETYVVYPRILNKRLQRKRISLQMLRKQISRYWQGPGAVKKYIPNVLSNVPMKVVIG